MENKKHKLDIFSVLGKIDKGQFDIWKSLSEEEQKEISPFIIMKWMTGTNDQRQVLFLNEFVNQYVFSLGKEKELLMKLLTVASSKSFKRYFWLGTKKQSTKKTKSLEIVKQFYRYSDREVNNVIGLLDVADIIFMAEDLGYDKDVIKQITKEFK